MCSNNTFLKCILNVSSYRYEIIQQSESFMYYYNTVIFVLLHITNPPKAQQYRLPNWGRVWQIYRLAGMKTGSLLANVWVGREE